MSFATEKNMKYWGWFLIKSLYLFLQKIANKCPWINTFINKGLSRKSRPMQSLITTTNKYILEIPLFCLTNNHNVLSYFVMFHSRSSMGLTDAGICMHSTTMEHHGWTIVYNKNGVFFYNHGYMAPSRGRESDAVFAKRGRCVTS